MLRPSRFLRGTCQSHQPHTGRSVETLDPVLWLDYCAWRAPDPKRDGLILYRFGADFFYANAFRFADEVCCGDGATRPVLWSLSDLPRDRIPTPSRVEAGRRRPRFTHGLAIGWMSAAFHIQEPRAERWVCQARSIS